MTKFKNGLFNVVVYSMLGWSVLSALYVSMPIEIQEMLPQMNWLTAVVSGGSTALLGTGGLAVKTFMTSAKNVSNEKYALLGTKFLELKGEYDKLGVKYDEVNATIENLSKLVKIDLESKLSNPLIDEKTKELIEGVVNEE